jgi:hypothetical protein
MSVKIQRILVLAERQLKVRSVHLAHHPAVQSVKSSSLLVGYVLCRKRCA